MRHRSTQNLSMFGLVVLTALCTLVTIQQVFLRTPTEAHMGVVQKIFYFHVPSAYAMYLGAAICFVGSSAYLLRASAVRDAMARAGAEVAVVFGLVVIITGPLWAVKAWGQYWTWDPRLTTTLLSFLVYVAYVVLRRFSGDGDAERKFAAALGFLGAVNLPVIHFSVQKWSGQHPRVISKGGGGLQHIDMRVAFALGMATFTLLAAVLFLARLKLALADARLRRAERCIAEIGLGEEN